MEFDDFLKKYQVVPVVEFPNEVLQSIPHPLVSCRVSTYNHGEYIRECLEGLINQKTDFPFEIVIGEDQSNDGTREICIEYAEKYPKLIRLFLHNRDNNIKINGKPSAKFQGTYTMHMCRGKYMAVCEGDDYWIDPGKLQKQLSFLENNSNYSASVHSAKIWDQSNQNWQISKYEAYRQDFDLSWDKILKESGAVFPTCSLVFRVDKLQIPKDLFDFPGGDLVMIGFLAIEGNVRFVAESMAVYRIHNGGIYQGNTKNIDHFIENRKELIRFYRKIIPFLKGKDQFSLIKYRILNRVLIGYLRIKSLVK